MIKARKGEENLIHILKKYSPAFPEKYGIGIGDDTAKINTNIFLKNKLLITTDSLVEDVHFNWEYCDAGDVAEKLFEMNASDILTKGGRPLYVFLNINGSKDFVKNKIVPFAKALGKKLKKNKIYLLGGDITKSAINVFTMTMIGEANHFIPRKNKKIKKGDVLALYGNIGGSSYALDLLNAKRINLKNKSLRKLYSSPEAKWNAPSFLVKNKALASIDTSDSFFESAHIISEQNNLNIKINIDKIKLHPLVKADKEEDIIKYTLASAEDFAVLAVLPKEVSFSIKDDYEIIGEVLEVKKKSVIQFYFNNKKININENKLKLFSHF
ncbi:MAG: AIR synthase related protein [Spirochaetia bacterium]|nr:AIR synthase related protein [Spirochaetia bacterium]